MNPSADLATAAADLRVIPTMRNLEDSWRRCCTRLRAELGEDVFTSWFGRMELEAVQTGVVRLSVPTRFLRNWIQSHYSERVLTNHHPKRGRRWAS